MPHVTPRPIRALVASLVVASVTGCATLGSPPLDEDLITDGSPEAKAALLREYRVVYEDGSIRRPGAADPGAAPSSQAFTDEAYNYLSTSEPAREELDGSLFVRVDRATRTGVLPALLALTIPIVVTAGASTAAIYGYQSVTSTGDPLRPQTSTAVGTAALYGSLGGLAVLGGATIFWALSSGVFYVLAPFLASGAYRDSTAAFNDELESRITRLADPNATKKPRARRTPIRIEVTPPETSPGETPPDAPTTPEPPTEGTPSETPAPPDAPGAPDAVPPPSPTAPPAPAR